MQSWPLAGACNKRRHRLTLCQEFPDKVITVSGSLYISKMVHPVAGSSQERNKVATCFPDFNLNRCVDYRNFSYIPYRSKFFGVCKFGMKASGRGKWGLWGLLTGSIICKDTDPERHWPKKRCLM
jgi:hypothetical protein